MTGQTSLRLLDYSKMTKPDITVAIPTYHRPDLLARALRSVQLQEHENWECIVFSDHCPKAGQVYEELFKEDKRIRFTENSDTKIKNVGAVGVNYALNNARSNVITYLCDDNVLLPNHLAVLCQHLAHPDIDVVETQNYIISIGPGDGGIKEILERGFYSDMEMTHEISPYADMLRLGNNIDMNILWRTFHELEEQSLPSPYNEDGYFMEDLRKKSIGWKTVDDCTAIYYARSAVNKRDEDYHNKVLALSASDIFVYPELMEEVLS